MSEGHLLHVISHTHWDREWYQTFEQFRVRLVDLIDNLLDILERDPGFKVFHMDGQTIVLEDYLEVRPEKETALREHIESGRILVGPWYLLNDAFLTSAESHVRNLLYGHQIAEDFGGCMKIGYLPDQFGNIGQMPQIFQGFGIDNCIFGRGYSLAVPGRKMELIWRGPDGSELITHHMAFWYNNAQWFPEDVDEAAAYTKAIIDRQAPVSATRHMLLMNGVDHLEPQPNIAPIIASLEGKLGEGTEIAHSTMQAFIDGVKAEAQDLEVFDGELREDRGSQILAGTLSARMYLKQLNERAQTALERWAEPWSALALWQGAKDDSGLLRHAWKKLLENHPHDSICGCSLDRVHEDMVPRFKQAEEVAECVTERSLKHLAGKIDTTTEVEGAKPVCIFNPLSSDRVEVAEIEAEFPIAEGAPAHVRVIGSDGEAVPSQFLDMEDTHVRYLHPQKLPLSEHVRRFKLAVQAEVGSGGWDTLQVVASGPSTGGANGVSADAASLTNELISVHVLPGGSLAIVDLERDIEYGPCNVFASNGDVGDEYKMIPPTVDRLVTSVGEAATVSLETCGPLLGRLRIDTRLVAPECATEDRRKRSDRTVEIPITSWVTLKAGSRRVEIETQITNRAKDHRVRALFPSGVDTDVARADGQFDVVARPIQPPADWHGASTFAPQQGFVAVEDEDHGLAVINQGLPEYEVLPDAERTVALTLLRCVGRLSMSGDAGAMDAEYNYTPEAQCLDTYSFRYAVLPYAGTWSDAGIPDEAQQFNVPLRGVQTGVHGGELPASDSLVVLDADGLVLSTVKKAETDDRIIARVFNPTTEPKAGRIGVKGASRAELVALSEESIEELDLVDGTVGIEAGPKQIVTVAFGR